MELQSRCRTLEEDLRLEKEWRQSLQDSIVNDRSAMAELQRQMEETNELSNVRLVGTCVTKENGTIKLFNLK